MGNKQNIKKNNNQKSDQFNQDCYLLCVKCWKKIPYLNTFIDGNCIKIKILCSCLENNNNYIIDLSEYINLINNRKTVNKCINHPEIKGNKYCMNCENWMCLNCFNKHENDNCNSELNNSNKENELCHVHNNKKVYFCKKCLQFFCKSCFLKHKIKNKKEHKGINVEKYLTNEKIKSKLNKFNEYKEEIIDIYSNIKGEILKVINSMENNNNNDDKLKYKNLIENKYNIHKNIDEQLKNFIEIILKNYEFFKDSRNFNRKYICNVIMNTSININYPKLNKKNTIIEQINYFINFMNSNYINKKLKYKLSLINTIEKPNNIIEMMLSLPDNKFVSINKDCEIQIWDEDIKKNIYTSHEHTNNITSIILLKNKKNFATGSDDSTIKIWDFSQGICIKTIITEGKPFLIYEVFNKENQIGCIPNRNSLAIYEYSQSKQNRIINISLENTIPWIEGLYQFPNDGRIILSTSGFFVIYSNKNELIKKVYISNDTPQIFLHLKNQDLAIGFLSKNIFIYDNNIIYKSRLYGHRQSITSIIEFDENKILSSSLDSNIILWRMNDYEMISSFINNYIGINAMILINKNNMITSSNDNNSTIDEWKIEIFD